MASAKPRLFCTPGCPYVLKVLTFLADAKLMDVVERVEDSPTERAYVTEKAGRQASFPALEVEGQPIIMHPDVDEIVAYLAKANEVDISKLYVYNHYIEGVFPRYGALLGSTIRQAGGWPPAFPSIGIYRMIVIGASGMAGQRLVSEAKRRGHFVTAASRNGDVTVDANDSKALTEVIKKGFGNQVVLVALGPSRSDPSAPALVDTYKAIISACREAGSRAFFVGGAGSLCIEEGGPMVMRTPGFPDFVKPEAEAHFAALEYLKTVDDVQWTYLSPPATFNPGERTGKYKLGGDVFVGTSISCEDYAVAALDEIANPKHDKKRFCVAN